MPHFSPYIHFDGNALEAFDFYKSVFGGDFNTIARYKDFPQSTPTPDSADAERLMHISLPINKNSVLMGSDRPTSQGNGTRGDLSYIYVEADSREEASQIFNGLVAGGGRVFMPLEDTFWGSYFGMLADKFGVQWMLAFNEKKA